MFCTIYAICKNEQANIQQFYETTLKADHVVVLDTGSEDQSYELLQKLKSDRFEVHQLDYSSITGGFRFDHARNYCLSLVPDQTDWCIFLDLDEVLEEDWRIKLERTSLFDHPMSLRVMMNTPTTSYLQEKIHSKYVVWKYPCHEVLDLAVQGLATDIQVYHLPDSHKQRNYLPLLERSALENPDDPRPMFYLGREYLYNNQLSTARSWLLKYVNMSTFPQEKVEAYKMLSDIELLEPSRTKSAEHYLYDAVACCYNEPTSWLYLAQYRYNKEDLYGAIHYATRSLELDPTNQFPTHNNLEVWAHDLLSVSYWALSQTALAQYHIKLACSIGLKDPRLVINHLKMCGTLPEGLDVTEATALSS